MQAAKVMAALIAIGCASAPVVQAQTRSPRSYSKVEIDKKIDQIRRDLIAKIPTPEQIEALLGPVYSKTDVDQKLNQLNAAIPQQTVSRQDLDKALQQSGRPSPGRISTRRSRGQQIMQKRGKKRSMISLRGCHPGLRPWFRSLVS